MQMCYERGCPSYGQYVHRYHDAHAHGRAKAQPSVTRTPNEDDFVNGELRDDR